VFIGSEDAKLYAFDAAGLTNCSGTPKACGPLWTGATGAPIFSSPAVASGVVYIGSDDTKVYAFDAAGQSGCSGAPLTCQPLWTGLTGGSVESSPAVADGVVYVGSRDFSLYAFDARGAVDCSGTPKLCAPLWSAKTGNVVFSSPAVDGRGIFIGSEDMKLHVFGLETVPPETTILVPKNGDAVSGKKVTLDAKASDNIKVSRVEFHLTGATLDDTVIATATLTQFGWIASWDSTTVPNGMYSLRATAFDPSNNAGHSNPIQITVAN
jgi:outer membrane protein assembly factor BamB